MPGPFPFYRLLHNLHRLICPAAEMSLSLSYACIYNGDLYMIYCVYIYVIFDAFWRFSLKKCSSFSLVFSSHLHYSYYFLQCAPHTTPSPPTPVFGSSWLVSSRVRQSWVGGTETVHLCWLRSGPGATADQDRGRRRYISGGIRACCAHCRKLSLNPTADTFVTKSTIFF